MKKNSDKRLRVRIMVALGIFAFFFGVVFFRAFELQVVEGKALERKAKLQHERNVTIQSKRGGIFDRNLEEFAVSFEVDSVFAHPTMVEDSYRVTQALATALSIDRREIIRRINTESPFVWIKRQIDLNARQKAAVKELEGVGTLKESRRFYTNRSIGANLIGFTGIDSNGLEGIELYYDEYLKGESVTIKAQRDARGKLLLYKDVRGPVEGMDVVTTIDKTIQYIAEKAVKKAVDEHGAKGASAVVMDPSTGEVLAMATLPTFDPNNPRAYTPKDWRNRAITDIFEPGSTLKAFLLSGALEEGVVRPDDVFYCENGKYAVKDRVFHDVKKHGYLTVKDIIKHSSNIGAAKIGEKFGKRNLYRYLRAFGFGEKTGIDLTGEVSGMLPHYSRWSDVSVDTISFGQGISVTQIQLAAAASAIANGGFLMKPRVVKYIRNNEGAVVSDFYPVISRRVISEDTARRVADMLSRVTEEGGTGTRAAVGNGFKVAGKTGTAQKPDLLRGGYAKGKYVASFMGFLPADNPKLTIVVSIDEPAGDYKGGIIAAPVFAEIARESLAYLGVFKNGFSPADKKSGKVVTAAADKDESANEDFIMEEGKKVPDFTGKPLRTVLRFAEEMSLSVEVKGSGRAIRQTPLPGTAVPRDGAIQVVFR